MPRVHLNERSPLFVVPECGYPETHRATPSTNSSRKTFARQLVLLKSPAQRGDALEARDRPGDVGVLQVPDLQTPPDHPCAGLTVGWPFLAGSNSRRQNKKLCGSRMAA